MVKEPIFQGKEIPGERVIPAINNRELLAAITSQGASAVRRDAPPVPPSLRATLASLQIRSVRD